MPDTTPNEVSFVTVEQSIISSEYLERDVIVDVYLPVMTEPVPLSLLLINDGQDLLTMPFDVMLDELMGRGEIGR